VSQNVCERLALHYLLGLTPGGVPSALDFEASLLLLTALPLDSATVCAGIGGMIYSNFLESRVNVTGPYVSPGAKSEQDRMMQSMGSHFIGQADVHHGSKFSVCLLDSGYSPCHGSESGLPLIFSGEYWVPMY